MINRKTAVDAEPTPELLAAYRTLCDCAGDLAEKRSGIIVAKAAANLAARTLWDVLGTEGAQKALRQLADELPAIVSEEGRLLEPAHVTDEEFERAGFEERT